MGKGLPISLAAASFARVICLAAMISVVIVRLSRRHTFKMSQWAANADVGEGDMGTNVVWMYPQLWQPKDDSKAPRTHLSDGIDQTHGHHYDKYNTHMGMPGH